MILTTLKNIYDLFKPRPKPPPGLWYVQLTINQPDGGYTLDTKRSALWTNRNALLREYTNKLGGNIQQLTADGDCTLYRYWDHEEEHTWRYFWIKREKNT